MSYDHPLELCFGERTILLGPNGAGKSNIIGFFKMLSYMTVSYTHLGACAQYCRMSYDLEDAEGHRLLESQYLLSLKDLNRTEILEEMLDGGVSSLKIEGRLKGIDYVRNVTAHYREQLDAIISRRGEVYHRASWGRVEWQFTPHPERTFSRRFTSYNIPLHRPIPVDSITPFTNKSVGERIGQLLECRGREIDVYKRQPYHCGAFQWCGDWLGWRDSRPFGRG